MCSRAPANSRSRVDVDVLLVLSTRGDYSDDLWYRRQIVERMARLCGLYGNMLALSDGISRRSKSSGTSWAKFQSHGTSGTENSKPSYGQFFACAFPHAPDSASAKYLTTLPAFETRWRPSVGGVFRLRTGTGAWVGFLICQSTWWWHLASRVQPQSFIWVLFACFDDETDGACKLWNWWLRPVCCLVFVL